jgi:hypothetical protein
VAKDSLLTRKIFCHMDKGLASKHKLFSFGGIYLLTWWFKNCTHTPRGLLKIGNHFKNNCQNKID